MHNLGEERMAQRGASGIRWKRFFRAIVGGSALGRTPMQIDELPGIGPFGAGGFYRRAEAQARVNQGAAGAQAALEAQAAAQAQAEYQAQAHHQQAPPSTPYADPGCLLGLNGHRVPNARDSILMIGKFSGVKQYKGLESSWRYYSLRPLRWLSSGAGTNGLNELRRTSSRSIWRERPCSIIKQTLKDGGCVTKVSHICSSSFLCQLISHHHAVHMYGEKKSSSRSWTEHLLYLTALMHSSENSEKLALERFVNYAAPHMKVAIMGRYDPGRTDDLHHAQEILAWAQEIEDDDRPIRNHVKGAVNAVGESRKCFTCGSSGHIARESKTKKK
ncbi:hypothetical protein KXD40_002015 [Peronospora effusa]|nr:hypothetical protein KXD40_002015 [Peronospora effusa]